MQHGRIDRPDLQLDAPRVVEFLRERDLVPAETRLSHIDRDRAVVVFLRFEKSRDRMEQEGFPAGLGRKRLHDASGAVAAGLGHRPVGIDDVYPGIGAGGLRVMDRHDLVELGRRVGIERDRCLRRHAILAPAHVHHQDLVSKPVHPGKLHLIAHVALVQTLAPDREAPFIRAVYGGKARKLPVPPFQLPEREAQLHDRADRLEVSRVLDP